MTRVDRRLKAVWLPELSKIGYGSPLPPLAHVGIQAVLSTIRAPEIHEFIQNHDRGIIGQGSSENPTTLLTVLGIRQFCSIADTACRENTPKVIELLQVLSESLDKILAQDNRDYTNAEDQARKINIALHRPFDAQVPPDPTDELPFAAQLRNNPHFRLDYYDVEQQGDVNNYIDGVDDKLKESEKALNDGDQYIPVFPTRNYEWELADKDGRSWEVPNLNSLAPISIEMWKNWASLTDDEIWICKNRALVVDSPSQRYLTKTWPMNLFYAQQYKCAGPSCVRVRLDLKIGFDRDADKHDSKLWNWHRPYFKCDCFTAKARMEQCDSGMTWFDHGIWYMLTYLHIFYVEGNITSRMMSFILFLSTSAKKSVMDHITFVFIREMMIEASLELYAAPQRPLLSAYEGGKTVDMIERLIKPAEFSEARKANTGPITPGAGTEGNDKRKVDLNEIPLPNASEKHFSFNGPVVTGNQGSGRGRDRTYDNNKKSYGRGKSWGSSNNKQTHYPQRQGTGVDIRPYDARDTRTDAKPINVNNSFGYRPPERTPTQFYGESHNAHNANGQSPLYRRNINFEEYGS